MQRVRLAGFNIRIRDAQGSGSTRASRAALSALAKRAHCGSYEVFGEAPKTACKARVLPKLSVFGNLPETAPCHPTEVEESLKGVLWRGFCLRLEFARKEPR